MKITKLNRIHKALNAKMVDFAGFEMPVQYSSIIAEHKAVRTKAGLFDISHMGEIYIKGPGAENQVNYLCTNDVSKLNKGDVQYSAFCYENGGIVDDLLVYKIDSEEFLLVVNASNKDKDFEWIRANNKYGAEIIDKSEEVSLLALQGPESLKIISKLISGKLDLQYYKFTFAEIAGLKMLVSRTGYTGELGYELYFEGNETVAENIWNEIMKAGEEFGILPVGLAARDSLRLEMGYCLYGNDISAETNVFEAGLGWITKLQKKEFIGKDALAVIKETGVKRKLKGITTEEKLVPRKDYELVKNGKKIGVITGGTMSPVLDKPVALAYIDSSEAFEENEVFVLIRNKEVKAKIVKLPFIKN